MYLHRHDTSQALAVWIFGGSTSEEWDEHFAHLREVATWSSRVGKRGAAVLISHGFSIPDARRKAELASLTEAAGYDPFVAFVTPNVAIRAGLAMFGWVQKAPQYEMSFFASSAKAVSWLERMRGERLERLAELLDELRAPFTSATGATLP